MSVHPALSERAGQSLVEVLVAITVGSIMVIAALSIITPALRGNTDVERIQAGTAIAKEMLENIRTFSESDWNNIADLATGSGNKYFLNAGSSPFRIATGTEGLILAGSTSSLVGYFKLDETSGNISQDYSGNNATGTWSGSPTAASDCAAGGCYTFDGTDDYIDTPDDSTSLGGGSLSFDDAEDWSVAVWYKGTQTGCGPGTTEVILGRDNGDIWANFGLCDGKAAYAHYNGAWLQIKSNTSVNDDRWHHLVFVNHANATGDMYVDGTLEVGGASSAFNASERRFVINNFMRGHSAAYTAGSLDEVRIYEKALSADEVASIYKAQAFSRYFYVEDVRREVSGALAVSGNVDPSTKKVTVTYAWPGASGNSISSYLTRFRNNIASQTDWSGGSGETGPVTQMNSGFAAHSNIDYATMTGSMIIDGLTP